MISEVVAYSAVLVALGVLLFVGVRVRGAGGGLDDYITARGTQSSFSLGLSFFASGMGAWILFAPPEVGAFVGVAGIVGYAAAVAAPFVIFAVIGPRLRRVLPRGHGLTQFVRLRYGNLVHAYIVGLAILYMVVFLIAELTAVGGVAAILAGIDGRLVILAVVAATLVYTTYGGLRASLRTDSWQAWMIFVLLALAAVVIFGGREAAADFAGSGLLSIGRVGIEAAVTLIIAVAAANLFHQGYWQRIWAAEDDRALVRGAGIGIAAAVPVALLFGIFGLLAAGRGIALGDPPVPFFALLGGLPQWLGAGVLVLGVALVASSVDTLQNALASLVAMERPALSLVGARVVTVLLMAPAAAVAFQGYSVLRVFLVADLLCATAVVPVLLGLWRRATAGGALAGSAAGLVGAVVPGGIEAATFPGAVPTLGPFAGALVGSAVVTVALSLAARREIDLDDLGSRVPLLGQG